MSACEPQVVYTCVRRPVAHKGHAGVFSVSYIFITGFHHDVKVSKWRKRFLQGVNLYTAVETFSLQCKGLHCGGNVYENLGNRHTLDIPYGPGYPVWI